MQSSLIPKSKQSWTRNHLVSMEYMIEDYTPLTDSPLHFISSDEDVFEDGVYVEPEFKLNLDEMDSEIFFNIDCRTVDCFPASMGCGRLEDSDTRYLYY